MAQFEESIIDKLQRVIREHGLSMIESDQQIHIDEPVKKDQKIAKLYFDENGNITSCIIIDETKRE